MDEAAGVAADAVAIVVVRAAVDDSTGHARAETTHKWSSKAPVAKRTDPRGRFRPTADREDLQAHREVGFAYFRTLQHGGRDRLVEC